MENKKETLTKLKREEGFTLIELILVIIVLGILAVSALPMFYDVSTQARNSTIDGIEGSVNGGLSMKWGQDLANGTDPTTFTDLDGLADGTNCTGSSACFNLIVDGGISDGNWTKTNDTTYAYSDGSVTATCTFTAATATASGTFVCN